MASTELITLDKAEEVLLFGTDVDIVSAEEIQADMVQRILSAETLEEAFSEFESVPVKDIEGVALTVNAVAWMKSGFTKGPKIYALMQCTLTDSKKDVTVSMGGRTTMARLIWAMKHDAMPLAGSFVYERSNNDPEKSYLTFKLAPRKVRAA